MQVKFIMISRIHKISVLLKITRIFKHFLREIIDFYFLKENNYFFSQHIMMKKLSFKKCLKKKQELEKET